MYGLFTKVGAGAVFSAGLSVLGIGMFCEDKPPHHNSTPAVATVAADAVLGAEVAIGTGSTPGGANPGTTNPGNTNPGTTNPGTTNPGNTNPGTTNPGHNSPPPNCGCDDQAVIELDPKLDVDVDVDLDADAVVVLPALNVGTVLPGSDCGCDPHDSHHVLGLPLLGVGH